MAPQSVIGTGDIFKNMSKQLCFCYIFKQKNLVQFQKPVSRIEWITKYLFQTKRKFILFKLH